VGLSLGLRARGKREKEPRGDKFGGLLFVPEPKITKTWGEQRVKKGDHIIGGSAGGAEDTWGKSSLGVGHRKKERGRSRKED